MTLHLMTGKGTDHMTRHFFSGGASVILLTRDTCLVEDNGMDCDPHYAIDRYPEIHIKPMPRLVLNRDECRWWTPAGDQAYYDGYMFGHFLTVTGVNVEGLLMASKPGMRLYTLHLQWMDENKYWFFPQARAGGVTQIYNDTD